MSYSNPYTNAFFGDFLITLLTRLYYLISGKLSLNDLASDEVQILVLISISSSAALVGSFLVLKRMTMLANSLSHTILVGIVIAYLLTTSETATKTTLHLDIKTMLAASLIMGIITAFATQLLTDCFALQEDASIAIVFTSLFALGVVLLTLFTRSSHVGTEIVFGNTDALQAGDISLALIILAANLILTLLFFKEYKITAFDPLLAKTAGISPLLFNYLLMVQVSATAIGAFRAVGVILVLSFMTGPVLTARLLTCNLKSMVALAAAIGALASISAVALSRDLLSRYGIPLSTGGIAVSLILIIFFLGLLFSKIRLRKMAGMV